MNGHFLAWKMQLWQKGGDLHRGRSSSPRDLKLVQRQPVSGRSATPILLKIQYLRTCMSRDALAGLRDQRLRQFQSLARPMA